MSEPFKWASPAGQTLCRNILKENPLGYEPHDWQVEGVCRSLDGINLFAITPTGSGKTSYFILVVLAVSKNPSLCPTARFPKDPCLIVICPTIPLQLEMASKMAKVGLKVTAINSLTRDQALHLHNEELWVTARTKGDVVPAGPEQLKCAEFEKAV